MDSLEVVGRPLAQARVPPVRVVPALDELEDIRASAWVRSFVRPRSSHSSVANDSHIASLYASPTEPIDGRTPASRQLEPNAIDMYWQPWLE